jgi:hypothetical protein
MFKHFLITTLLFAATALFADPTVTSITPGSGPAAGGTLVRIKGTGFTPGCLNCSPPIGQPIVTFGTSQSTDVRFIDSTTLDAITPSVLPSTVAVTLGFIGSTNSITLPNAFTFVGDPGTAAFDPVLFPLFIPSAHGQFGSEFRTTVRLSDKGPFAGQRTLQVYGIDRNGPLNDPPTGGPLVPFGVTDAESQPPLISPTTGRILYVPKGESDALAASIRVTDITKQATSFGVEVPVIRLEDFTSKNTVQLAGLGVGSHLVFMGIPADPRFRCMLRLYSLARENVLARVTINGKTSVVPLKRRDDSDIFEPAYSEFTDFPILSQLPSGQTTFRVVADNLTSGSISSGPNGPSGTYPGLIWGMISVTNNESQQITIITPH